MFRSTRFLLPLLAFVAVAARPVAAGDVEGALVNNPAVPWGLWGPASEEIIAAADVEGGKAKRITIAVKPANPWDVGIYANSDKPVKKGDVLLLAFWARAAVPPQGNDFIRINGRMTDSDTSPNGITPETSFLIGRQWKLYYAAGAAAKDYPAGALHAGVVLGTDAQTIDLGPVKMLDFGPGYDPDNLPHN